MITIKPADSQPYILTFDGEVFEIFAKFRDESHRLHVTQIQHMQLNTDQKGKHELVINSPGRVFHLYTVDEAQFSKVQVLIYAVQSAISKFKF